MNAFPVSCFDPELNSYQVNAEYSLSVKINVTYEANGAQEDGLLYL